MNIRGLSISILLWWWWPHTEAPAMIRRGRLRLRPRKPTLFCCDPGKWGLRRFDTV